VTLQATLRRNPAIAELLDRFDEFALRDAWLVAGCLAQTVWNVAAGYDPGHGIRDIDLIYHDANDLGAAAEQHHEQRLRARFAHLPATLDVKNQARVHLWYERRFGRAISSYSSAAAAIATFPTTATSLGVRTTAGNFEVCAPFGLADLLSGVVRANPRLVSRAVYEAKAARWQSLWPALTVLPWDTAADPAISGQTTGGTP
jgi:hypothetical protein